MAIIDLPDNNWRSVRWQLMVPQQVNRSEWTGRRQVMGLPGGGARWSMTAEHVPLVGEAQILAWRAFFAKLKGSINTFRMPMTEADQKPPGTSVAVDGAGQVGNTLTMIGLAPASTLFLKAGQFIQLLNNEQPLQLTADLVADGGTGGTAQFEPAMRVSPPNGTGVVTRNPSCQMALDDPLTGWSVDPGQIYGFSITATEAF